MKIRYKDFWLNFGGKKCDGKFLPRKKKLDILNMFSNIIIEDLGYHNDISFKRRCEYEQNYKFYHSLIKYPKCFACSKKAKIRHHIIGLAKGGTNSRLNFVSLCRKCHSKVHKKRDNFIKKYEQTTKGRKSKRS